MLFLLWEFGDDAVDGGAITEAPLTKVGQGAVKGMVADGLAGRLPSAAAVLGIPGVGRYWRWACCQALRFGAAVGR
jgi:hypothetical protein